MRNEKSIEIEEKRRQILELRNSPEGLAAALQGFRDPSWRVRKTALTVLLEDYRPEEYIDELIKLLYLEDNAGARNTAIEALVSIGTKAVSPLMEAFRTDNHDVRKFIIDVLGVIGGKEVIPLFLDAIRDEDENVRASAVEFLGKFRESSVIDALIEILRGDDVWIAYPAVDALGRIGDRRVIPVLREALHKRPLTEPALRALAAFSDPDTLNDVVPLLLDRRRSIQEETLRTLETFYRNGVPGEAISEKIKEHLGADTFDLILRYTGHEDISVRRAAAIILGLLRDPGAAEPLLEITEDEELRDVAVRALVFLGKDNRGIFLDLLERAAPERRGTVVKVMADIADPSYRETFIRLLQDRDGHVIVHAVRGLGAIGDGKSVEALKGIMDHPYPDVQNELLIALSNLKDRLDPEEILQGVKSPDPVVRRNSVLLLGALDYDGGLPELGLALRDPLAEVRVAAIQSLTGMLGESALRYLRIGLTDEAPDVRNAAVEGMGKIGSPEALESLLLMLNDPDEGVRASVAGILSGYQDERAMEALLDMLAEKNGFVLTRVIESLTAYKSEVVKERLAQMLETEDREIRRTLLLALSHYDETEDLIRPFLFSDDWATRLAAVRALGRIGSEKARDYLEGVYDMEDDETVKKELEGLIGA